MPRVRADVASSHLGATPMPHSGRAHRDPKMRKGRRGRPWRRMRAAVLDPRLGGSRICWLCGHDGADSVDHVVALAFGGAPLDRANLRPAHCQPCPTCGVRCNTARGTGAPAAGRRERAYARRVIRRSLRGQPTLNCSEDWTASADDSSTDSRGQAPGAGGLNPSEDW